MHLLCTETQCTDAKTETFLWSTFGYGLGLVTQILYCMTSYFYTFTISLQIKSQLHDSGISPLLFDFDPMKPFSIS